jgi:hypothetical protein
MMEVGKERGGIRVEVVVKRQEKPEKEDKEI